MKTGFGNRLLKVFKTIKEVLFESSSYDDESFVTNVLYGSDKLKKKYSHLRRVIKENDEILDLMASLSERKNTYVNPSVIISKIESILSHTLSFVQALNDLTDDRYAWLYDVFEKIQRRIMTQVLELSRDSSDLKYIYRLKEVSYNDVFEVGGKAAALSEAKNALGILTPDGIVISVSMFKDLLKTAALESVIKEELDALSVDGPEKISDACKKIQSRILTLNLPRSFCNMVEKSLKDFGKDFWAVRSSAVEEDGELSFAGQFRTFLNVPTDQVMDYYLRVLASLYEERVVYYMLAHGLDLKGVNMAVLILEMIEPEVSGVMYTTDPNDPSGENMLVSAMWGLGKAVVSGDVRPDILVLDRKTGKVKEKNIAKKSLKVSLAEGGGVKEEEVESELQKICCLKDEDISKLYDMALLLESHFKVPQDIEWAIERDGSLYLLQTRPLKVKRIVTDSFLTTKEAFLKGEPVSPGAVSGAVFWLKNPEDLERVPDGSIVIVPSMNPELARVISKIRGLISLKGTVTVHLATVLREFQIPALIVSNLSENMLCDGEVITLDGFNGSLYKGRYEDVILGRRKMLLESVSGIGGFDHRLEKILQYVLPLTLTEIPENEVVLPDKIKTIHDLVRFVHEISIREVFLWTREDLSHLAHILDSPLVPMIFYIIDLEGGLVPKVAFKKKIKVEDIVSVPFLALWRGMTHPGVRWAGAVPFEFGSLISIISRSFVKTKEPPGKAFALISKDYMNFHSRLAYHFAAVESFCSEDMVASNYVNFKFQGGGATFAGRLKRLEILKSILTYLGFRADVKGDRLNAIVRGLKRSEMEHVLDQLGRLMAYVRQMDMAVAGEQTVKQYIDAFLKEDYSIVHR